MPYRCVDGTHLATLSPLSLPELWQMLGIGMEPVLSELPKPPDTREGLRESPKG